MTRKRTLFGIAIIVAFVGYLLWSTLASQTAACRVCVVYKGRQNCATASAASAKEATRNAQMTACGVLAAGMNEGIACGNAVPAGVECKSPAG